MTVQSFRELRVWQKSFLLTKNIYLLSAKLPREEIYGLSSQMRRAAISIVSNIAEGQQRNNRAEYCQFLGVARGSAAELSAQIALVNSLYKFNTDQLQKEIEDIQKMLFGLIKKLRNSSTGSR